MACRSVLKENRELLENFDKTMLKIEILDLIDVDFDEADGCLISMA